MTDKLTYQAIYHNGEMIKEFYKMGTLGAESMSGLANAIVKEGNFEGTLGIIGTSGGEYEIGKACTGNDDIFLIRPFNNMEAQMFAKELNIALRKEK